MSNNSKHGKGVVEDAFDVPEEVDGMDCFDDADLEGMLYRANRGRETPYTTQHIKAELQRRAATTLVSAISTQVVKLAAAINADCWRPKQKLSTHVDTARRAVNRLKRLMAT
jgi:hypothetical protein